MTQLIQSNPVQKQSRNYPYLQRFENNHFHQRIEKYHYRQRFENSMTGKDVLSLALFRRLSSCLHHLRRGLFLQLWRLKTRRILWGQIGEQLFVFLWKVESGYNYENPPFRFIKEEADAGTKAMPNKVEKEKLETEKAAPSKVGRSP